MTPWWHRQNQSRTVRSSALLPRPAAGRGGRGVLRRWLRLPLTLLLTAVALAGGSGSRSAWAADDDVPAAAGSGPAGSGPAEPEGDAGPYRSVVTASRRSTSLADAPALMTVVGREELARSPESTLDRLLEQLPGHSSSRSHLAECGPGRDITLRGLPEQKRTLVLVDGIPINDGITGAVNWSLVPKDAVERVEIVRGPMSALYGSGAMGGVIQIITRRPKRPNETELRAGYGSLDSYTAGLLQGGRSGPLAYLVSGSYLKSDGYVQAAEPQPYHTANARRDLSLLGSLMLLPDDRSSLALRLGHVDEDYSRGIRTDDQRNTTSTLSLTYERLLPHDGELEASVFAHLLSREVDLGARPHYASHDHTETDEMARFGHLLQGGFRLGERHTVTLGLDSAFSIMDRHNEYAAVARESEAEGNQLLASLFAQDEVRFAFGSGHTLLLTAGVRLDHSRSADGRSLDTNPAPSPPVAEEYPDRAWTAVNPKLALVYHPGESTTLRLSSGRAFAAPTLFELYTVFTRGPLLLYGNPDLDPETAWSSEAGLDQRLGEGLLLRLSAFHTRGQDFVGYRSIGPNRLQIDNITAVQVLGAEGELSYALGARWTAYGSYAYQRTAVVRDEADAAIEGNRLPFEPLHRARLGAALRLGRWLTVDLGARYESERYTDIENTEETMLGDHVSLDLTLSGAAGEHVRWLLAAENLLDDPYDIYSVPTERSRAPGMLLSGQVAFGF